MIMANDAYYALLSTKVSHTYHKANSVADLIMNYMANYIEYILLNSSTYFSYQFLDILFFNFYGRIHLRFN